MIKIFQIYKLSFFKWLKNPWAWFFGLAFPIVWTIVAGVVWGKKIIPELNITTMNFIFPGIVVMMILTFAVSSLPIIFASDRLTKRVKQLSLANITKFQYLGAIALFHYTAFFCVFLVCWIIALSAFGLSWHYPMTLTLLFWPIIIFAIHFFLAVLISDCSKSVSKVVFATFVILYFLLFSSGATIPSFLIGDWFKYLQYVSPSGCAVLIMIADGNPSMSQKAMFPAYIILMGYAVLIPWLALKYFSWE